jgi:L-amino acid N-acyltransferase YncA
VAVEHGRVVGWIVVHTVSPRPCYAGVVEHSVYVEADSQGNGIGRALLERLITDTEQAGIWTIQTGIFPENKPSLALHLKCGFRVVGTQERIGQLDGVWRDVVVVERRSKEI